MLQKDNWKLDIPIEYLENEIWNFKTYTIASETWEHEHCEVCGDKISDNPNDINKAYASTSKKDYWWVCPECYDDLQEHYNWNVIGS